MPTSKSSSGKRSEEPSCLRRGKAVHRKVQADWEETAEGKVKREKRCTKPSGRKGRMDIHVGGEGDDNLVAVVEIKASDWDKMTTEAVRRNVRRQIKQIWDYIESELSEGKEISPGIVFPKRPKDPARQGFIEHLFAEEAITVVWEDETIEEVREKNRGA